MKNIGPDFYNSRLEINLSDLQNNLDVLKNRLKPGIRQMAVIKANAYGHGAVRLARFLDDKVDWFGVCSLQEAIELRDEGFNKEILVFSAPYEQTAWAYKKYNITAVVSDFHHFELLEDGTHYHLQFDTGMGRFGFYDYQLDEVLDHVKQFDHLKQTGLMSHFATADTPDSDKVKEQLETFKEVRKHFSSSIITHISNTGGIAYYPEAQFDMVRHGIGMYGYPPGNTGITDLKPIMAWKSYLLECKPVQKGMTVSYRAEWICPENGYLGIIPVGYADGLRRNLGGKLKMSINGKSYPIIGIVTMDYVMLYLGKDRPPVNSEVIVMGNEGNTAQEWGNLMESISYEVLCSISNRRVHRVYVDD
ncbi:MAG TPA: alanine racemase [Balneolales bacterium]|nr:alanine racemase [Balneolales bacterium]